MKRVGCIDDDLALPLLKLLRDILVGGKWNSEKNDFSPAGVFNGLWNDAGTEFVSSKMQALQVHESLRLRTSIFFRAKTRASAVPILPEPIMAYLIEILRALSGC